VRVEGPGPESNRGLPPASAAPSVKLHTVKPLSLIQVPADLRKRSMKDPQIITPSFSFSTLLHRIVPASTLVCLNNLVSPVSHPLQSQRIPSANPANVSTCK